MAVASDAPPAAPDQTHTRRRGLVVNNSLYKEKVPFVTKDGSMNGEWRQTALEIATFRSFFLKPD
jgi:hypothetical protein